MPHSVLLAEDDPIAREVLALHLHACGFEVHATAHAAEAEQWALRQRYDLLLFDQQLADGSGMDLLARLRSSEGHANARTPALAMSAALGDLAIDALLDAGFIDAMEKPVSAARLARALGSCGLGESSMHEEAPRFDLTASEVPVLDDAIGLRACGSADVLEGLRGLLANELPAYRRDLGDALDRRDLVEMHDQVHRLRSALGFCGASQLLALLGTTHTVSIDPGYWAAFEAGAERLSQALSR